MILTIFGLLPSTRPFLQHRSFTPPPPPSGPGPRNAGLQWVTARCMFIKEWMGKDVFGMLGGRHGKEEGWGVGGRGF